MLQKLFSSPYREYAIAVILVLGLFDHYLLPRAPWFLWATALIGAIIPLIGAWKGVKERRMTIEAFNFFALGASLLTGELPSALFIGLMLTFAAYLDWRTKSRASNAVEELLKLKPHKAYREKKGHIEEISADLVRRGDIVVVKNGERVPVDGVIVYGEALINEAALSGESKLVEKYVGDEVCSSTLSESGVIKIRATKVGEDSTIARMAKLVEEALKEKSKTERLADRFAGIFFPIVLIAGIATYFFSGSLTMTIAFFLVVCADDIAVSIPLAITASLGHAAKRGVIIKGGEWLDALARAKVIVFDKTGTLTYGDFRLAKLDISPGISAEEFWRFVGIAEKFSEHPIGRAIFKEAKKKQGTITDPDKVHVSKGMGVKVQSGVHEIIIGNEKMITEAKLSYTKDEERRFNDLRKLGYTAMFVFVNGICKGMMGITDVPRSEAKKSIIQLEQLGLRVLMLTGDNAVVAADVSQKLGLKEFRAGMTPEGKLAEIAGLSKDGVLAMVGDGVNDAPALARADIGIAMGAGGTAVAVETANIVILTDEIDRIPEMIILARRTVSVVRADMGIWLATNVLGIALVFTGIAGPALAAFYNFATDFLPLLNSARLFRHRPS